MKEMQWLSRMSAPVLLTITLAILNWAVGSPSPSNLRAIFVQARAMIAYVDNWQIYVVDSSGTHPNCLTCTLNLTEATAPAWSPDAKQIAFKMLSAENSWAIAITNADGSNLRKIADYDSGNSDIDEDPPAWSPDGNKIAYATYRGDHWGIFINNTDGSNEQQLSNNDEWVNSPKWSSDGKNIAFASRNGLIISSPGAPGSQGHIYAEGKQVSSLAWNPNSVQIAFSTSDGLFIIDADGANLHRLVDFGYSLAWSPDGATIAFISASNQNCRCKSLELIAPDGSHQHVLYRAVGIVDDPTWSADSKRLLFMANADAVNDSWYNSDIYITNSDGTDTRHLMKGWSPAWSSSEVFR